LKIKRLSDVGEALKIKELRLTPKPLQSHSKATPKTTPKQQTVENQALDEIFWSFGVNSKTRPLKPAHPPRPLARFLQARCLIFLYIGVNSKHSKENHQILENQGFEALEWSLE
jgi:hypothetical protein